MSGFTVPANGAVEYPREFDLRQSLSSPPGLGGPSGESRAFLLKPAIRIMNVAQTGGEWGAWPMTCARKPPALKSPAWAATRSAPSRDSR